MARGGKRDGAGRPKGSGPHGEPTERIRVPASMLEEVSRYVRGKGHKLPLYSCTVQAGFPAPADDHIADQIDIGAYLVGDHPESSFFVRAQGPSMKDAGINDGALLLVDRSAKPAHGKIVVAAVDGELTVKYLIVKKEAQYLMPANPLFPPIPINPETGVTIWGVVRSAINEY